MHLSQRDPTLLIPAFEHLAHDASSLLNLKWQQRSVNSARIGINRHDWLSANVLGRVRHKSILAHHDYNRAGPEVEIGTNERSRTLMGNPKSSSRSSDSNARR